MHRILKFFISLLFGAIIFIVVIWRVGLKSVGEALTFFFGLRGLAMAFLTFLALFFSTLKWRAILKQRGEHFPIKSLMPLWLLGFSLDYLTPFSAFGGEIFRIYFTKKRFPSLSWEKTMSSVAIDKLLDATVFLLFLIIGLLVFTLYGGVPFSYLGGVVFFVAPLFLFLSFFYFKRFRGESVLEGLLRLVGVKKEKIISAGNGKTVLEAEKEVFRFFSLKRKGFWQALGITLLRYFVLLLRCFVLIFLLTGNVTVLKALAVYGFANLATLTPVPAVLGALEISEGLAFRVLGLGFDAGAVFSMVWRASDLLFCLIGLLFLIKFTVKAAEIKVLNFFGKE